MIYDRHLELQSKWDKSFWARGYYVSTIGNITEEAIKKYITVRFLIRRLENRAGKTMKLKADVKLTGSGNANTKLKWSSSKKKYATVNQKGKVKAKNAGKGKSVTITAMAMDGSRKKAKIKIKIN